jgi:hypothetical protein
VLAAEADHQPRELDQREAGVVARSPVARDREDPPVGDAERRARVAALGRIGIDLMGGGTEALVVGLGSYGQIPLRVFALRANTR